MFDKNLFTDLLKEAQPDPVKLVDPTTSTDAPQLGLMRDTLLLTIQGYLKLDELTSQDIATLTSLSTIYANLR